MKKIVFLLLLASGLTATAQTKPPAQTLEQQVAQQKIIIAQLQAEVNELQFQISLYDMAMGTTARRNRDRDVIQQAQEALQKANEPQDKKEEKQVIKAVPKK